MKKLLSLTFPWDSPLTTPYTVTSTSYLHDLSRMDDPNGLNGKARQNLQNGVVPTEKLGWVQRIRNGESIGTISLVLNHVIPDPLMEQIAALQATLGSQVTISQNRMHITVATMLVDSDKSDLLQQGAAWATEFMDQIELPEVQLQPYRCFVSPNFDIILTWKPIGDTPNALFELRNTLRLEGGFSGTPNLIHTSIAYAWDRENMTQNQAPILAALDQLNGHLSHHPTTVDGRHWHLIQDWTSAEAGKSTADFSASWENPKVAWSRSTERVPA